jgi:hypothetical protein
VVGEPAEAEDRTRVLELAVGADELQPATPISGRRAQPTISVIQEGSSTSVSSLRKTSTSPSPSVAPRLLTAE